MKTPRFSAFLLCASFVPLLAQADDAVVVTADRSGDEIPQSLIGASITVLDAEALDERQTRIVSDVLRDVPGVAVNRTGGIGGPTQIRIRGTEGNHVLVLVDGIKVSDPYDGEFDFGTLIADDAAKIEVLRGQQSALYGSDAIGGVIQYITLTGREAPGFTFRGEGGSFGTDSAATRYAGVTGALDYSMSASYYHTDGFPTAVGGRRDVGSDSAAASTKLIWAPVDGFKLTAVGRYSYTYADSNDSDRDPASPTFGLTVDTPGVHFKNIAFYGLLRGELGLLDDRWTNAVTVQIADSRRDGFDGTARTYGDTGDRTKASFESVYRLEDGAVKQRFTFAADFEREEYRNRDPSGFAFNGQRHTDNTGLVGQYDFTLNDALSLGAAIRHDRNDLFEDVNTYRVQGSYLFPGATRLHAAAGSGIKNPEYFELYGYSDGVYIGNPGLKPEKSEGWEVGVEQGFLQGAGTVGLTYFSSRLRDEIVTIYPPPDFIATSSNLTQDTTQRGVEFSLQAHLSNRFRADASYTWLKATSDGMEAVRRPGNLASFAVTGATADGKGELTLVARYNGRQKDVTFTDPSYITEPIVTLGSYTLINLDGEYRVTGHLSLLGRIENLAGKRYQEVYSFQAGGRGAYAGFRVRF
jgi:vitamin B12 transporter